MAGTTTNYSLPYPEPTDLVADYPALGQDLAEDLDTILAAKVTGSAAGTAPTSPVTGQVWVDTSTNAIKVWDGAAWVDPSNAGGYLTAADVSGTTGSPATGNYTDADGDWTFYKFTGNGSITLAKSGLASLLVVGGGGGCNVAYGRTVGSGAGAVRYGSHMMPSGAVTITVGAGGSSTSNGGTSSVGSVLSAGGGQKSIDYSDIGVAAVGGGGSPGGQSGPGGGTGNVGGGALGTPNIYTGLTLNYDNSSVEYAIGGNSGAPTTPGSGKWGTGSGINGIVIVRVKQ